MLFKEISPIIILLTIILLTLITSKVKRSDINYIDSKFAVFGVALGLIVTFLNLIYSNHYLITVGPFLAIASALYLRYRTQFLSSNTDFNLSKQMLKAIQIIYWICISISLVSYFLAEPYSRPTIFFVSVSIAVGTLGLEILFNNQKQSIQFHILFYRILTLSLILRFSAYFITPYQVGSDPWSHADIIKDISSYGTSYLPNIHEYYSNYPLMHIYASIISILGHLTIKSSMFIIGTILVISTIFVFLIAKKITNNIQIALLSMLLINFSDFHIQWSIQVIAMSFGITIYTFALYLLIGHEEKINTFYKIFIIMVIFVINWTHTVSSFILLVSLVPLYSGPVIHRKLYLYKHQSSLIAVNATFLILFILLLSCQWMDPHFPFFRWELSGLIDSLSNDAEFLGRTTASNIGDSWSSILNIFGFLTLIFFGIIGSLQSLSKEHQTLVKVCLIFMIALLYSIFFIFPLMGIRNILPYRWPAFIYINFILFSSLGIFKTINIPKINVNRIGLVFLILITFSFIMITNSFANADSPIFGKGLNQKMVWTESEIETMKYISSSYSKIILTDTQTRENVFTTYLKREFVGDYVETSNGDFDWEYMKDKMLVWRKASLDRPVQVNNFDNSEVLLGPNFKQDLDRNYFNVFDSGNAEAYLGSNKFYNLNSRS